MHGWEQELGGSSLPFIKASRESSTPAGEKELMTSQVTEVAHVDVYSHRQPIAAVNGFTNWATPKTFALMCYRSSINHS